MKTIKGYSVGIYSKEDLIEMMDGYTYSEAVKEAKKISRTRGRGILRGQVIEYTIVVKFEATPEEIEEDFGDTSVYYTDYRKWEDKYMDGKKVERFVWQWR